MADIYNAKPNSMSAKAMMQAEEMAIMAHESLIALGYEEEAGPLRLPNKRGVFGIVFASMATVFYTIAGYFTGLAAGGGVETYEFLLSALDGLTIGALLSAVVAIGFIIAGFCKKHATRIPPIIACIVLVTGPVVLHIIAVALGVWLA